MGSRGVRGDAIQPGTKTQLANDLWQRAPGGDKGVLREVAPEFVVADKPGEIDADARVVPLEERSERLMVALPRLLDERLFRCLAALTLNRRYRDVFALVRRL